MQHLDIPFERLNLPDVVEAIPLKLAYNDDKQQQEQQDPVTPSAQAVYGADNKETVPPTDTNVWFIALTCITVLVVILLISYYIVVSLRTQNFVEDDEYEQTFD
ncbi:ORF104 [Spodoptera frugiperda granulovirus]|uniref:Ac78 n=1 Tax=Spodoptera frugiperda granulovirus TaxID=307454 RepID=A0A0C5B372_9BBAC|nr:ORF104 [Spodoptera frugiperda granulovirus]AJK91765.1 ORF104 [Spodoptera frugiperda granulovirus]AXS01128.1 Ac78 [Spodoptera frugiperda granulovirus]